MVPVLVLALFALGWWRLIATSERPAETALILVTGLILSVLYNIGMAAARAATRRL